MSDRLTSRRHVVRRQSLLLPADFDHLIERFHVAARLAHSVPTADLCGCRSATAQCNGNVVNCATQGLAAGEANARRGLFPVAAADAGEQVLGLGRRLVALFDVVGAEQSSGLLQMRAGLA